MEADKRQLPSETSATTKVIQPLSVKAYISTSHLPRQNKTKKTQQNTLFVDLETVHNANNKRNGQIIASPFNGVGSHGEKF